MLQRVVFPVSRAHRCNRYFCTNIFFVCLCVCVCACVKFVCVNVCVKCVCVKCVCEVCVCVCVWSVACVCEVCVCVCVVFLSDKFVCVECVCEVCVHFLYFCVRSVCMNVRLCAWSVCAFVCEKMLQRVVFPVSRAHRCNRSFFTNIFFVCLCMCVCVSFSL